MKKKKNILDHSIYIPTKNRPYWVEYGLMHYDYYNYAGEIIIIDDSSEENFKKLSEIIYKFSNKLKIKHIKGKNMNKVNPRHKSVCDANALIYKFIKTTYYSQVGDDDIFYTPNLDLFISYMNENESYSSVTGNQLIYDLDDKNNLSEKKIYMGQECHYEDPIDRLTCYACESGFATYGVVRTKSIKTIRNLVKEKNSDIFVRKNNTAGIEFLDEEIPWVAQIYIAGKIASLNYLQYFRLKSVLINRVERAHLSRKIDNYVLGVVSLVFNNTLSKSCHETFSDLKKLVNKKKSKYPNEIVDYQIKQFIWSFLKNYDGAGLNRNKIDYSVNYKKIKNKKNYIRININLFSSAFIKIILRRIFFIKNYYFALKKFKKNHSKFKKVLID